MTTEDTGHGARMFAPASARELYRFNHTYLAPIPFVDTLPDAEKPTVKWYVEVIWQILRNLRNRLNWIDREERAGAAPAASNQPLAFTDEGEAGLVDLTDLALDEPADLDAMDLAHPSADASDAAAAAAVGPASFSGGLSAAYEAARIAAGAVKMGIRDPMALLGVLGRAKQAASHGVRPGAAAGYLGVFTLIEPPWFAARSGGLLDDDTFAWMRVAGSNPLVLEGVSGLDARFPVTEAHYRAALGDADDSLARAGAEGRLYLADYKDLAGLVSGTRPYPKFAAAPLALFALPRGAGARRLRPVAIQCGQDPAAFEIFTPADGEGWLKAKFVVQNADGNHHELISHLARTHLLIGPIVMCTHRQLDAEHPVSKLLRQHFEGTLSINDAARTGMLGKDGPVDRTLTGTIESSVAVTGAAFLAPYFNHGFLPRWLSERHLESADLEYPYRDDALLVWAAIERWVGAYVRLHYASDAAVAADEALAAWAAEVVAPDAGRVPDFGEDGAGRIHTVDYLIGALTMIIFTASAQHAVVNFGQGDLMTLASTNPVGAFAAPPRTHAEGAQGSWLDMVAPLDLALFQVEFLNQLGGVYYTKLGQYERGFGRGAVTEPLERFQRELAAIGAEITARNATRHGPFTFLIPDRIPQGINI